MKIFIASPLGFAESTHPFIEKLCRAVEALGHEPGDPWSLCGDLEDALRLAETIGDQNERRTELNRISHRIAERNASLLRSCGGVLAVLEGVVVDSGTASEIGYAFGLGDKVINGYRGDFRRSGENDGVCINLQVQYWIEQSGGTIVRSLSELSQLSFTK